MKTKKPKPTTFIIRNQQDRVKAVEAVIAIPLDGSAHVYIGYEEEGRRLAQNRLYWYWLGALENQTGHSKDWFHSRFARTYLSRIYLADPENPAQRAWAAAYAQVQELASGLPQADQKEAMIRVCGYVSTTWATVEQFTDYLEAIEQWAYKKECRLPHRGDEYYEAMGASIPD